MQPQGRRFIEILHSRNQRFGIFAWGDTHIKGRAKPFASNPIKPAIEGDVYATCLISLPIQVAAAAAVGCRFGPYSFLQLVSGPHINAFYWSRWIRARS